MFARKTLGILGAVAAALSVSALGAHAQDGILVTSTTGPAGANTYVLTGGIAGIPSFATVNVFGIKASQLNGVASGYTGINWNAETEWVSLGTAVNPGQIGPSMTTRYQDPIIPLPIEATWISPFVAGFPGNPPAYDYYRYEVVINPSLIPGADPKNVDIEGKLFANDDAVSSYFSYGSGGSINITDLALGPGTPVGIPFPDQPKSYTIQGVGLSTASTGNVDPRKISFIVADNINPAFPGRTGINFAFTIVDPAGGPGGVDPVPEPGEWAFAGVSGLSLMGMMVRARRRSKKATTVAAAA